MTINEAIACRHMVRQYTDRKLPEDILEQLTARIQANNERYGLSMSLVAENTEAFSPVIKLILAKGVRNYVVLAGKDEKDTGRKLGYCGADVMLFAQTLGLNTWWVGGTFSRKGVKKHAAADAGRIDGVIAVGYGATQGVPHKSKRPEEISHYAGTPPEWFVKGVEAVLLAPTALNKQAFHVEGDGVRVSMTCDNGIFSHTDLGIGMYHFESGAGKEHFQRVEGGV